MLHNLLNAATLNANFEGKIYICQKIMFRCKNMENYNTLDIKAVYLKNNNDLICRTCLKEVTILTMLKDKVKLDGDEISLKDMLYQCTNLEIGIEEKFHQSICTDCLQKLCKAYCFRQQCWEADLLLKNSFNAIECFQEADITEELLEPPCKQESTSTEEVLMQDTLYNSDHTYIKTDSYDNEVYNGVSDTEIEEMEELLHEESLKQDPLHISDEPDNQNENSNDLKRNPEQLLEKLVVLENSCVNEEELQLIPDTPMTFKIKQIINTDKDSLQGKQKFEGQCLPEQTCVFKIKSPYAKDHQYLPEKTTPAQSHQITEKLSIEQLKKKNLNFNKPYKYVNKRFLPDETYTKEQLQRDPKDPIIFKLKNTDVQTTHKKDQIQHLIFKVKKPNGNAFDNNAIFAIDKRRQLSARTEWLCSQCGLVFPSSTKYNNHILQLHSTESGEKRRERYRKGKFKCPTCDKVLHTRFYLKQHMRLHDPNNEFKCNECGKHFLSNSCLKLHHLRRHTNIKNFFCEICGKGTVGKVEMDIHMRFHTGHKPYACNVCEKTFFTTSHRAVHLRTHLTEAKYKCEVCDKSFLTSKNLSRHTMTHNKTQCSFCTKSFTKRITLRAHMRIHTGEIAKSFSCDICGRKFSRESDYIIHRNLAACQPKVNES